MKNRTIIILTALMLDCGYVAAQNVFTLTGYKGYDPEVSVREGALTPGLDFSAYPRARVFTVGINLGF